MSAIIDYIIRHKQYKEVNSTYFYAKEHYSKAFNLWLQEQSETLGDDYESRIFVHSHINDIRRLHNWIELVERKLRLHRRSLEWFFYDRGFNTIPTLTYKEYKLIAYNINVIQQYESYIQEYNNLLIVQGEAVRRVVEDSINNHTYDQIKLIATSKNEIWRIGSILKKAHACEKNYPLAWRIFAHGRIFDNIPLNELETVEEGNFQKKEDFVKFYKHREKLCNVIMGEQMHDIDSFDQEILDKEECCMIFARTQTLYIKPYNGKVQIEGKELRRAILDSTRYGTDVIFTDQFTISEFYQLRQETDDLGIKFDDIIAKVNDNYGAIKSFNYEKSGKSVVYIQDYIPASKVGTPLYNYIESYREQKEKRDCAKQIAANYPLGFACLFDSNVDFDSCELSVIVQIIDSKQRIIAKESEEVEKEWKREEEERKRKEEEEKREKIRRMKACVSGWHITRYGFYHDYLYEYLKTTAPREADEHEWNIRHLIWAFKNDPNKQDRQYSYSAALNEIVPKYERKLRDTFGSLLSDMTLVCLPASNSEKNRRRWKDFSRKVCSDLDMWNAYDHIHIEQEAIPKHLGGDGRAVLSFDTDFFSGKYVILCDDIKTTGSSIQRIKYKLESIGTTVICALTIGTTIHE